MTRVELTSVPGASPKPPFVLILNISDTFDAPQRSAIIKAATRWSQILFAGSGPASSSFTASRSTLSSKAAATAMAGISASPALYRPGGDAPARGTLSIDIADLDTLTAQKLKNVVLHEIGHLLGFGMTIWDEQHLTSGPLHRERSLERRHKDSSATRPSRWTANTGANSFSAGS